MTGNGKKVTYKMKFEIPVAFIQIINDAALSEIDVFWNEKMVCRMASIAGISSKPDPDPNGSGDLIWTLSLSKERVAGDPYPSLNEDVDDSGDLRLHALQLAMFNG